MAGTGWVTLIKCVGLELIIIVFVTVLCPGGGQVSLLIIIGIERIGRLNFGKKEETGRSIG